MTKHAITRGIKHGLTSEDIIKVIKFGEKKVEGKTKRRYTLQTKRGLMVAICAEYPDLIKVITITKGRR